MSLWLFLPFLTGPQAELSQEQGEAGSQGPGKGAIVGGGVSGQESVKALT